MKLLRRAEHLGPPPLGLELCGAPGPGLSPPGSRVFPLSLPPSRPSSLLSLCLTLPTVLQAARVPCFSELLFLPIGAQDSDWQPLGCCSQNLGGSPEVCHGAAGAERIWQGRGDRRSLPGGRDFGAEL